MTPKDLKEAYLRGENIIDLLKFHSGSQFNTEEIIETSYDLQHGSYVKALNDPANYSHKVDYGASIAAEISSLTSVQSILEPGVGEGTTLSFVLKALRPEPIQAHGFDISWSRIANCRKWLSDQHCNDPFLSLASILQTPYADNSFDVVYTSHTIEPNGGNELPILTELFRIASRYLILLEPGYELAGDEARERMRRLGYCTGLVGHAEALGMKVIKHELFPHTSNPLNPTAITVIAKNPGAAPATPQLVCSRYLTPIRDEGDALISPDSLRAYPKIKGIPCLRPDDAIIASAYQEF